MRSFCENYHPLLFNNSTCNDPIAKGEFKLLWKGKIFTETCRKIGIHYHMYKQSAYYM